MDANKEVDRSGECNCEFDDEPDYDGEASFHYIRACECGMETPSLHCIHDGIQGVCVHCGRRLPSVRYEAVK